MSDKLKTPINENDNLECELKRGQIPADEKSNPGKPENGGEAETPQSTQAYTEDEEELIKKRLEDLGYL